MVQAFPFSGVLNYDDPDEVVPSVHHRDALNIVFRGTLPNLRAENTPGTREKVNPFLVNDGNNLTIGRFYDSKNNRIYIFNYRSDDKKAIYMYDTVAASFVRIAEEGVNVEAGALGFTETPIIHINIIYGDSAQGDILCYLNSNGIPKKINIQRAISGGYGTIQASYMDIAKEPSDRPPVCVYEDDPSNTVNNLRKRLFRFKIRWVFDDQDKSVTSSQSEMPLPASPFDQAIDADPTKNCRIAVTYQTGPENVKRIEILASNSLGNVMSDWYLVSSLEKDVEGIPDNDIATFLFYNDKGYQYINVDESNQLYDYVPLSAQAQALLNGNTLAYGNVTEGYANLTNFSNGTNTSTINVSYAVSYAGVYFYSLVAGQEGKSGFGSGNIHIVVRGLISQQSSSSDTFVVYFTDNSAIGYTVQPGDDAAAVINGLRNEAIADGFTIVSVGSNDLYIFKTGIQLARTYITSNYILNSLFNSSLFAYDWSSKYGFGLVYLDEKGRSNGVVFTNGFSVQSIPYSENNSGGDITKFQASIYHRPPDWAYYFQWVRTKNLSKQTFVQWISDRTFKDSTVIANLVKYAYISIASLNVFKTDNPGSPLGYTFAAGDRIRFFKRFNVDGTTANLYGNSRDYEIVASPINPTINGVEQIGQFIKIVLPSTNGTFDFGSGFDNYFIELYTPAQPVANNLNLYYEFGERYAIANAGLSDRFHQGMLQNQTSDLATPATYDFIKGDAYIRSRSIQTGNVYKWDVSQGSLSDTNYFLFGLNFAGSTYNTPGVTGNSVPIVPLTNSFNPSGDSRSFLNVTPLTVFTVSGTVTLNFTTSLTGDSWSLYVYNIYSDVYTLVQSLDCSSAGAYVFNITSVQYLGNTSSSITLENDRVFFIAKSDLRNPFFGTGGKRDVTILSGELKFTVDHVITQRCIDPNFSDYFASLVNSNGRAWFFDPNANQVTYPVMYRWSLSYQTNTNINQTNRFYEENMDEVERSHGSLKRMISRGRVLTFFQERKCAWTAVYNKAISENLGGNQLITTDSIITKNNVQYYDGDFGVGNQPDSVVQSGFVYYFTDPIRGKQLRLSRDGITDLSEVYKTQTWAAINIPKYLNFNNYTHGGRSRITGTFNVRKDNVGEYLCVLQPGTFGDEIIVGQTMGFDEIRNSFTSLYSFAPECIVCAETTLYSWVNGRMYIHDQTAADTMNKFYGVSYDSFIKRAFNAGLISKKSWESLTEIANSIWDCPEIYTNAMSYGDTPQQSNLISQDFENKESNFSASFQMDINSVGGISDGDVLKGNLIVIKFRATNPNSLSTLSAINLYFIDSPLTNR